MQVEFMADGEGEIVLPCDARAEEGEAGVLVCRMRREWEKGMNGAESRAYRPLCYGVVASNLVHPLIPSLHQSCAQIHLDVCFPRE